MDNLELRKTSKLKYTIFAGFLAFFIYFIDVSLREESGNFVKTNYGILKGISSLSRGGKKFLEFKGIPYAKPPVNDLRFEPPVPIDKWEGVREATSWGSRCLQVELFLELTLGDEDCLYLNVFTPRINPRHMNESLNYPLLPVIVFIHGGLFMVGGSDDYRPEYFMDEEVVLVTINYRLGAFGFLNTGDGLIRGNQGLKDQEMALKWVREEIHNFGGDGWKVTLVGQSAGAASVHYHLLSKTAKEGFIQGGISMSGTIMSPWAFVTEHVAQANRLVTRLSCEHKNQSSFDVVKCLKLIPPRLLIAAQEETLQMDILLKEPLSTYGPTIEAVDDSKAFLVKAPKELLEKEIRTVPWITGVNSEEGLIYAFGILRSQNALEMLNNNWDEFAPKIFKINSKNLQEQKSMSEKLKTLYFGRNRKLSFNTLYNIVDLFSDFSFNRGLEQSVKANANKSPPAYIYLYSHRGSFGIAEIYNSLTGIFTTLFDIFLNLGWKIVKREIFGQEINKNHIGTCHGDDVGLLFKLDYISNIKENHPEFLFSRDLTKLWAQFATTGMTEKFRGIEWKGATSNSSLNYLRLDGTKVEIVQNPFKMRLKYWEF